MTGSNYNKEPIFVFGRACGRNYKIGSRNNEAKYKTSFWEEDPAGLLRAVSSASCRYNEKTE